MRSYDDMLKVTAYFGVAHSQVQQHPDAISQSCARELIQFICRITEFLQVLDPGIHVSQTICLHRVRSWLLKSHANLIDEVERQLWRKNGHLLTNFLNDLVRRTRDEAS